MIKIPGTKECLPAIRQCLEEGININVTLLFSVENYLQVAQTYIDALSARLEKGQSVDGVRSVASFFVSRVDSIVDNALEGIVSGDVTGKAEVAQSLLGKFGIANSKIAYLRFQELFEGEAFAKLKAAGAQVQRPLWASTSTKNPAYRDVLYVEQLIGPDTVNTVPHNTLEAFVDHGECERTIDKAVPAALDVDSRLREVGVDVDGLLAQLQVEGVEKFAKAFDDLNAGLKAKLD
jgi:transaldolase